jgi:hypothetical protein
MRGTMTTIQAIFLGMMLSWTPTLTLLAYFLWREETRRSADRDDSSGPEGPVIAKGLDTIDVSSIGDELFGLNHDVFATKLPLIDEIGRVILSGTRPPNVRTPVLLRNRLPPIGNFLDELPANPVPPRLVVRPPVS